jgi:hypothetical protein
LEKEIDSRRIVSDFDSISHVLNCIHDQATDLQDKHFSPFLDHKVCLRLYVFRGIEHAKWSALISQRPEPKVWDPEEIATGLIRGPERRPRFVASVTGRSPETIEDIEVLRSRNGGFEKPDLDIVNRHVVVHYIVSYVLFINQAQKRKQTISRIRTRMGVEEFYNLGGLSYTLRH